MDSALIIFAKSPRLGAVKTRLQSELSANKIRRLYIAFLHDTLSAALQARAARRRVIAFTPRDGKDSLHRAIGRVAAEFDFVPQREGDLGIRMEHAFSESFARRATRTVIIGTDSPSLPSSYVEDAFAALKRNDLVLGPSMDGGFYLVGIRRAAACRALALKRLFHRVDWSTNRVLQQTIRNAKRDRLRIHLLPPWYDVDDADSLRFLRVHIDALIASGIKDVAPHTARLLQHL